GAVYSYLFGPRATFSRGRVEPFAQVLIGGAHASSTLFGVSQDSFAMTLGGGLDLKATNLIAIRVAQVEYFPTFFSIPFTNGGQSNLRVSAGIVFRLGKV